MIHTVYGFETLGFGGGIGACTTRRCAMIHTVYGFETLAVPYNQVSEEGSCAMIHTVYGFETHYVITRYDRTTICVAQ